MHKYIETYPDSITLGAGLISSISSSDTIPWAVLTTEQKQAVERAYCARSGFKQLSSVFVLIPEAKRASLLETMFGERWKKLWNLFTMSYNPLDAYVLNEKGTNKKDTTGNTQITFGHTISEEGADSGTVDTEGNGTSNGTDSVFGFNSINAVPSDSSTDTSTATTKETRNLSASRDTAHGGKDNRDSEENEQGEYQIEKTGNIGYTAPQELIRREFEVWKSPFFNMVFDDIDSFITIQVYD